MIKHLEFRIMGRVQGVYFRQATKIQAEVLSLTGSVRNCDDGSVCIEVEGDDKQLSKFAAWCQNGPKSAKVDEVKINEGPVVGFQKFQII
ncbi:MAG: acylphosphatase [bacterium]